MLVGPTSSKAEIEEFTRAAEEPARQLHRPADPGAVDLPDLRRPGRGAAPCRSPALRAVGAQDHHHARRPHARGAEGRLAGREFEPGRRHQGHLGAGAGSGGRRVAECTNELLSDARRARHSAAHARGRRWRHLSGARAASRAHAEQHRQESVLDGALPAARQVDGAADRGDPAHGAAVARRGSRGRRRDLRHGGRVPPDPAAVERRTGQPDRLPGVRREQPLLDRELDRRGAAQRPRGAQQHHGRCVGEPERPVARAQRPACAATAPRSIAAR